jgi:hypothetical protein
VGQPGGIDGERLQSGLTDRRGQEEETGAQVAYTPRSEAPSVGTLVPVAMRDAIEVARWYLRESQRVLNLVDEPQVWGDARALDAWLQDNDGAPERDVLNRGPACLRTRPRRDAAVKLLEDLCRIRREKVGRTCRLVRNPLIDQTAAIAAGEHSTASVAGVAEEGVADTEIESGEL